MRLAEATPPPWIRLDRHELAGAFGDLGTSLPLLTGLIVTSGLHAGAVLATFGFLQIFSGLRYGLPMSVQPLKAVAALAIAGHLRAEVVWASGLVIAVIMLALQLLGLVAWLGRQIPLVVIRGLQLALGIKLAILALGTFVPSEGWAGLGLAIASAALFLALRGQRRVPPGLVIFTLGAGYALARTPTLLSAAVPLHFTWPAMAQFEAADLWLGFAVLALPQLPLSLANSIYATERTVGDLFPHRRVTSGKLALTYAMMNFLAPLTGGAPVCHGAGGVAGHHAFGARTGGSVILCGSVFVLVGLLASDGFGQLVHLLPLPTLGVLLGFEAVTMARLATDVPRDTAPVLLTVGAALLAVLAPYGFGVALVAGTLVHALLERRKCSV